LEPRFSLSNNEGYHSECGTAESACAANVDSMSVSRAFLEHRTFREAVSCHHHIHTSAAMGTLRRAGASSDTDMQLLRGVASFSAYALDSSAELVIVCRPAMTVTSTANPTDSCSSSSTYNHCSSSSVVASDSSPGDILYGCKLCLRSLIASAGGDYEHCKAYGVTHGLRLYVRPQSQQNIVAVCGEDVATEPSAVEVVISCSVEMRNSTNGTVSLRHLLVRANLNAAIFDELPQRWDRCDMEFTTHARTTVSGGSGCDGSDNSDCTTSLRISVCSVESMDFQSLQPQRGGTAVLPRGCVRIRNLGHLGDGVLGTTATMGLETSADRGVVCLYGGGRILLVDVEADNDDDQEEEEEDDTEDESDNGEEEEETDEGRGGDADGAMMHDNGDGDDAA
jgi:hypothetical protein